MAFIIQCDNRGCSKSQAACLDTESNQVICMECGKSITNVSSFAKAQLKSLGQTTKKAKTQQTYSVKCNHCSVINTPTFVQGKLCCKTCKKELTGLGAPFVTLLKDVLRNESE
jgi:hypothetical protein